MKNENGGIGVLCSGGGYGPDPVQGPPECQVVSLVEWVAFLYLSFGLLLWKDRKG